MPIYDFKCSNCGHQLELMRKISDSGTIACPECKQETLSKMLSAPSFQLSGSGWYATDFKDKKTVHSAQKESAEPNVAKAEAPAACKTGCACH